MSSPYAAQAPDPQTAGGPPPDAADDPARALLARLGGLRGRVSALVERRAAGDPTADDPLRGLYLSEEAVRHLLGTWPAVAADAPPAAPDAGPGRDAGGEPAPGDRLARLAGRAGLTALDVAVLLVALAPDVDRTFEPLYGYLNDDVSRRRATVGLALDLSGVPAQSAAGRARLHVGAPLAALGLLEVDEPERPFLTRSLRGGRRPGAGPPAGPAPPPAPGHPVARRKTAVSLPGCVGYGGAGTAPRRATNPGSGS
ncbi:ATP-binding protein, partial [Streptomyces lavendulae]